MRFSRIPLEEQLKLAAGKKLIFPDYPACAIRSWAVTPLTVYLGGDSEEGKRRQATFMALLGISRKQMEAMRYKDAAALIAARILEEGKGRRAREAVRLLAGPPAESYIRWKEMMARAE